MGELQAATESVSPVIALIFPFLPVLILLGFYFAAGGGFNDDDDDDFGGGKGGTSNATSTYSRSLRCIMPQLIFLSSIAAYFYFNVGQYVLN